MPGMIQHYKSYEHDPRWTTARYANPANRHEVTLKSVQVNERNVPPCQSKRRDQLFSHEFDTLMLHALFREVLAPAATCESRNFFAGSHFSRVHRPFLGIKECMDVVRVVQEKLAEWLVGTPTGLRFLLKYMLLDGEERCAADLISAVYAAVSRSKSRESSSRAGAFVAATFPQGPSTPLAGIAWSRVSDDVLSRVARENPALCAALGARIKVTSLVNDFRCPPVLTRNPRVLLLWRFKSGGGTTASSRSYRLGYQITRRPGDAEPESLAGQAANLVARQALLLTGGDNSNNEVWKEVDTLPRELRQMVVRRKNLLREARQNVIYYEAESRTDKFYFYTQPHGCVFKYYVSEF